MTKLPVTPSLDPKQNAPLTAGVLLGVFVALMTITDGKPVWLAAVAFVVIVVALLFVQLFTHPEADLIDAHGPNEHLDPPGYYDHPPAAPEPDAGD